VRFVENGAESYQHLLVRSCRCLQHGQSALPQHSCNWPTWRIWHGGVWEDDLKDLKPILLYTPPRAPPLYFMELILRDPFVEQRLLDLAQYVLSVMGVER
jgi:hypothetical protein